VPLLLVLALVVASRLVVALAVAVAGGGLIVAGKMIVAGILFQGCHREAHLRRWLQSPCFHGRPHGGFPR
jgi:hypothetical protein